MILVAKFTGAARQMSIQMHEVRTHITQLQTQYYEETRLLDIDNGISVGMLEPTDSLISYMEIGQNQDAVALRN